MKQIIQIKGLRVYGYHGVLDFEKQEGQYFIIDASIWLDATRAVQTDSIADTVSYAELAHLIAKDVKSNPVNLLETLSQRLAELLLVSSGPLAKKTKVTVSKPDAPIDLFFETVKVTAKAKRES
jgi:dihydroneopterin aldolase